MRGLIDRVVGAIASWAHASGQAADARERDALSDELTALVLPEGHVRDAGVAQRRTDRASVHFRVLHPQSRGLDASHPDLLEFIDAKAREEDRGRALLAAGYPLQEVVNSLAFQHATHSVRVTDELMRLAIDGPTGRCGRSRPARCSKPCPPAGCCAPARKLPVAAEIRG